VGWLRCKPQLTAVSKEATISTQGKCDTVQFRNHNHQSQAGDPQTIHFGLSCDDENALQTSALSSSPACVKPLDDGQNTISSAGLLKH